MTTIFNIYFGWSSADLLSRCSRRRMQLCIIVLSWCIQAPMNLNRLALCPLDNCMTRSFLRPILGTHVRLCLDGAMRTSIWIRDLDLLVPILRASLSCNSMSSSSITLSPILQNHWCTESNFWRSSNDWSRSSKSLSSNGYGLIFLLFHDDCRLVTRPDVLNFLHAFAATRVTTQIPDLPDMTTWLGSTLHVVENDVFDFIQLLTRIRGCLQAASSFIQIILFHKRMFLHEESIIIAITVRHSCLVATILNALDLTQLCEASLVASFGRGLDLMMLLDSSPTSSLASNGLDNDHILTLCNQTLFMRLKIHLMVWCWWLGSLRRCFIYASCMLSSPLCIDGLVWCNWVSCSISCCTPLLTSWSL